MNKPDLKNKKNDLKDKLNKKSGGLTYKWVMNFVLSSVILLTIIFFVFAVSIKNYYYNSVKMKLESAYYPMVSDYFVSFSNDYEAFVHGAESFVYDFSEKNVMEVWVIDS
ncbi:MAG: hypothetical protein IIX39_07490, partial [Clostridia bacterium]|nr:hypothetical protein [Clostridia bacterium]